MNELINHFQNKLQYMFDGFVLVKEIDILNLLVNLKLRII